MTKEDLIESIKIDGIVTTGKEFFNSSITWTENIDPSQYIVEIIYSANGFVVNIFKDSEYFSNGQAEITEKVSNPEFWDELINNAEIFEKC